MLSNMDVYNAIQTKLAEDGNVQCMDCVVGTMVPDLSNSKYVFTLVHCPGTSSQGMFVYRFQNAVKSPSDLTLQHVFAINNEFQYLLGTPTVDQAIFQVKINSSGSTLVIEVPFESKSSNFFMNIKKCTILCVEKMKQNITPQFQWIEKYKAQVAGAIGQTTQDPFGVSTFYTSSPDPSTDHIPTLPDTDPFAEFAIERQSARVLSSHPSQALRNSTSGNGLPSSNQNSYVNCPKDPGLLVDLEGNILTPSMTIHPAPPESDFSFANPWNQSANINRISSASSSSSESKTLSSSLGFEDDFTDIVKTSTSRPTGTLYENASTASIPTSSSTGSFDMLLDQSTRSSTLTPEDEVDFGGYATIKPVFRPAGIRPEILKRREQDYTYPHDFRFFVGTWNVNGQTASEHLGPWLNVDERKADIYAIGFQELDLSKEAFLFNDSAREEEWNKAIEKALQQVGVYMKVKVIRLVGMMILVFAKERHAPFIHDVIAETVGTGIMGKMGNKGGVAVRFEFHNTSFCFVNSHLAAHMEEYERRNQDYNDICLRMKFETLRQSLSIIRDHEVVIWMGDLNYRISDLSVDDVKFHIEDKEFKVLLEHDQLFRQLRSEKVFKGFKEGEITFRPTYKYDPGTDNWDTSEKQRVPAWCDRILYKGTTIKQLVYRSHDKLKLSDHKPVSSLFDIEVKVVDEKKFKQVVEEEIRKLDRQENESLPQVALSLNNLEFKDVCFMSPQLLTLDVANVGQVNTVAKFVNKLDDKDFCKPWLKVEPSSEVFMMPGDTVEIFVTVQVDKNSAAALNSGEDTLEDILVFHLDNGKDYYITVSGNYMPSSFGSSIEALVQMHGPIREMSADEVRKLECGETRENDMGAEMSFQKFDIPKEVWMLVDHLFRNATKTENLFSVEGLHKDILAIRDCLDIGFPDEIPGSLHSVAEALLMFLESLREPVIPYKYYNKCLECTNNFLLCKQVLTQIPRSHRNVFKYLAAFIRELLMNSDENKLDTKTLATVFGEIFLRVPPSERDSTLAKGRTYNQQISRKKATFVYQFIINEYDE